MKWIKKLFQPSPDKMEAEIKELFDFLLSNYGFKFVKNDLGDMVYENGNRVFYGPYYAYQIYNDKLCINIMHLEQRDDKEIYITEKYSDDQNYIRKGLQISSYLAYDLKAVAVQIKSEASNNKTVCGISL